MNNDPTQSMGTIQPPPQPGKSLPHQRIWPWFRHLSRKAQIIICVVLVLSCSLCVGVSMAASGGAPTAQIVATPTAIPTTTLIPTATPTTGKVVPQVTEVPTDPPTPTPLPTPKPTNTPAPQGVHYPPTTEADLHNLAAQGDASAIYEFHSESVGMVGACPQPKREVTVDPSVTGQQLAEDLLAYFYAQQLDSPCGSIVFAYHNQGEANDVYTAGRIKLDVTDASGAENVDPNASNLTYTLTLDIGGDLTGAKEYVVTY